MKKVVYCKLYEKQKKIPKIYKKRFIIFTFS